MKLIIEIDPEESGDIAKLKKLGLNDNMFDTIFDLSFNLERAIIESLEISELKKNYTFNEVTKIIRSVCESNNINTDTLEEINML